MYKDLGPDDTTRTQKDTSLEVVKGAVACRLKLHAYANLLDVVAELPGIVAVINKEADDIVAAASGHLENFCILVMNAKVRIFDPLTTIKPFLDPTKNHWMDDFEGDFNDLPDLLEFFSETIFTTAPDIFQNALAQAETAHNDCVGLHELFGHVLPESAAKAQIVINKGRTTNTEGTVIGCVSELHEKPIRLKREMTRLYNDTPSQIWQRLHPIVEGLVCKYATVAIAKKPNVS